MTRPAMMLLAVLLGACDGDLDVRCYKKCLRAKKVDVWIPDDMGGHPGYQWVCEQFAEVSCQ